MLLRVLEFCTRVENKAAFEPILRREELWWTLATPVPASIEPVLLRVLLRLLEVYTCDHVNKAAFEPNLRRGELWCWPDPAHHHTTVMWRELTRSDLWANAHGHVVHAGLPRLRFVLPLLLSVVVSQVLRRMFSTFWKDICSNEMSPGPLLLCAYCRNYYCYYSSYTWRNPGPLLARNVLLFFAVKTRG